MAPLPAELNGYSMQEPPLPHHEGEEAGTGRQCSHVKMLAGGRSQGTSPSPSSFCFMLGQAQSSPLFSKSFPLEERHDSPQSQVTVIL